MRTRKIGSLDVSVVGLGCNNFGSRLDATATAAVVDACFEEGINFFDTADVYGNTLSEEYLGKALGARRAQVVVATKFAGAYGDMEGGGKADYVRRAVAASLRRLGTDYIDLYIYHRPDPATPIAETLGALNELVKEGTVREIGCSNFSVAQLREAEQAGAGGASFVNLQNEYNLLERGDEAEVLPECERLGIGYVPYFPLASGLLTGKFRRNKDLPAGTRIAAMDEERRSRFYNERNLDIVEELAIYTESRGHQLLDAAFSFALTRPAVASVIAGAMRPEQVAGNAKAASWELSSEEIEAIDAMTIR